MKRRITLLILIICINCCSFAFAEALSPPRWLIAIGVEGDALLTWEMPKGSAKAILYKKRKGEESFRIVTEDALGFYMEKGIESGIHIYKLQAVDSKGVKSNYSEERIIQIAEARDLVYTPPKWQESFISEDNSILLRWEDTCDVPVRAYNIYKKPEGKKDYALFKSEPVKSLKDTSVALGQKISYKVCPVSEQLSELACSAPITLEVKKSEQKRRTHKRHKFVIRKTIFNKFLELPNDLKFYNPTDILVDQVGKIYVSDTGSGLIHIFKYSGKYERSVGAVELEDGTYDIYENLLGIDVDSKGFIYGVDSYKGVVKAFDQKGNLILKIDLPEIFKEHDEYNFIKYGLVDVSIDNKNNLINIIDNYNNHIYKFDEAGKLKGVFLEKGYDIGQVHLPTFSYIDDEGFIFVSDTMNQKVRVFNSKMVQQLSIGDEGFGLGTFIRPKGIAKDKKSNIFIADSFTNIIQVFSPEGGFKYILGNKNGKQLDIATPNGIFVDKKDKIYIVEKLINRIQVRQLTEYYITKSRKKK